MALCICMPNNLLQKNENLFGYIPINMLVLQHVKSTLRDLLHWKNYNRNTYLHY